jgi:hypothetical protein
MSLSDVSGRPWIQKDKRLNLILQLMLTSENQTANAREPEINSLKTDERNS